jgi:hypothetical protein
LINYGKVVGQEKEFARKPEAFFPESEALLRHNITGGNFASVFCFDGVNFLSPSFLAHYARRKHLMSKDGWLPIAFQARQG